MRDIVPILLWTAVVAIVLCAVGFGIGWELSLWDECRADHSWSYCLRVLNK